MPKIKGWKKVNDRQWVNKNDRNVKVSIQKLVDEWRAYLHGKAQDEVIARANSYNKIRREAVKEMKKRSEAFKDRQKERRSGLEGLGNDLMSI